MPKNPMKPEPQRRKRDGAVPVNALGPIVSGGSIMSGSMANSEGHRLTFRVAKLNLALLDQLYSGMEVDLRDAQSEMHVLVKRQVLGQVPAKYRSRVRGILKKAFESWISDIAHECVDVTITWDG